MSDEQATKKQKTEEMKRVLIFGGKTGWIGQMMGELVEKLGKWECRKSSCRLQYDVCECWKSPH